MLTRQTSIILLSSVILFAFSEQTHNNVSNISENNISNFEDTVIENELHHETKIKFPNFEIVFHDFKGYELYDREFEGILDLTQWPDNSEAFATFDGKTIVGRDFENFVEIGKDTGVTLIARKDTIHLAESFGDDGNDNRINNTLVQILPKNSSDKFKISYCYLSSLNEVIDYRNYSETEIKKADYDKLIHIEEKTPFNPIKDSFNYFFRVIPHSSDMVEVTVVNGEVVPKKYNTKEQIEWENKQWENEISRIRKKYNLRDTMVVIPREYDVIATLTKENKLFNYSYDSFVFRIERYANNKLAETKYIVIAILYGC